MRLRMYDTTFALVGEAAIRGVDPGGLEVIDDVSAGHTSSALRPH